MLKDKLDGIYTIERPADGMALPLIFDSPHSGRVYPDSFTPSCPMSALHRAEDNEVDLLFSSVPAQGGTLLCAEFPRTFIDVNRAGDDLDPELIENPPPDSARPTPRSHAGIGLIRRLVRPGMPVYDRKLNMKDVEHRIENYYKPYHAALDLLIGEAHYKYGIVWHLNCHSMPSSVIASTMSGHNHQPDFVLGDRDGASCDPFFTNSLRHFIKTLGYRTTLNNPYKGVELVRRHGRPNEGFNSLQIEVNKALYWDEAKNKRNKNYNVLKNDIDKIVSFCADHAASSLTALAAD